MKKTLQLVCIFVIMAAFRAAAVGWPAQYEGVMLQGFYWDSYTDSRWTNLESQADELSEYFSLIWVPNGARSNGSPSMGYMPVYWFTNYNSSFGNERELRSMISTFKEKGIGVIADVVVNHRVGVSNWTNFPSEKWDGQTWKLGPEHICCDDEVAGQPGQATPTGAHDTGEHFDGGRDLDHTSPVVQNNVKNYIRFLLTDMGFAGVRYDMVKGYGGQYTKIYNQYAHPAYSVGEYFDSNYDAVANWINATGRESAAFDFPLKFALNKAFSSNDLTQLVWNANGTTPQPAGMIHFGYQQLAVTFIDNHDTYRDGYNKFSGNIPAANAFILCSPGTPCVFLPHWKAFKSEIKKMIAVRNAVGVHNTSAVEVLKSSRDCYLARVTGKHGELAVRIGSTGDVPAGYTAADIRAQGNGYCIWSKTDVGGGGGDDPQPTGLTVYFDNSVTSWSSVKVHYWGASESTWPGVDMTLVENNIWKYTLPAGTLGVVFNNGEGSQTADVTALVDNHIYRPVSNEGKPECVDAGEFGGGAGGLSTPSALYVLGNIKGSQWLTSAGVAMTRDGDSYRVDDIEFEAAAGETRCYFNLTDALGADWDELNSVANRYGAATEGEALTPGTPATMVLYAMNVSASGCQSWTLAPGAYDLVADFAKGTITATPANSGIGAVTVADGNVEPVYYNLQGMRVDNPGPGLYIARRGAHAERVLIR